MNKYSVQRRVELDWLRVLAILTVFIYHTTRFFNLGDWYIKNLNTYTGVEIWNESAIISFPAPLLNS